MFVTRAVDRHINSMEMINKAPIREQSHLIGSEIKTNTSFAATQMLTVTLESSFSKTFCAWSGGNLRMEVITLAIVCRRKASKECRNGVYLETLAPHFTFFQYILAVKAVTHFCV